MAPDDLRPAGCQRRRGRRFRFYGLLHEHKKRGIQLYLWLLVLGAGSLFGAGIITPTISVLSAVEGLGVAAPSPGRLVSPVTVALVTGLFSVQVKGTSKGLEGFLPRSSSSGSW